MANETIVKLGTQKTLEANGAQITATSVVQADDASYAIATDGAYYPDARFVACLTFGTGPTEGKLVSLYARPINIDGTADSEVPEAARPTYFVGNFVVNNVTSAQYIMLTAQDVPWEADYYLHNQSDQTISAGWTLKVTPMTVGPAA